MSSSIGDKNETIRDQLEVVYKATGKKPKELEPPCELNELFNDSWKFFLDLHSVRSSNGFSLSAITYSEMQSYFSLNQIDIQPWEIELIKIFDNTALKVISDNQEKQRQNANKKNIRR